VHGDRGEAHLRATGQGRVEVRRLGGDNKKKKFPYKKQK